MKVSELSGAKLDYWVGKAIGREVMVIGCGDNAECNDMHGPYLMGFYSPSTDWSQGGPIIERERIELTKDLRHLNLARIAGFEPDLIMTGPTPLIAAMRCFVASKFGENVPE